MWVCLNCEAENDPGHGLCNVCNVSRSERNKAASGSDGKPTGSAYTGGVIGVKSPASHGAGARLFAAISIYAAIAGGVIYFLQPAGQTLPQGGGGLPQAPTDQLVANETLERNQPTRQEEANYRAASGNVALLKSYVQECRICAFKGDADIEINRLEHEELAQREARIYADANRNLASLRAYLNSCNVCVFKFDAESEIARLQREELAQRETQTYFAAQGDIGRLRAYLGNCKICAFRDTALNGIRELEEEAERRNPKVTFEVKSNHPNSVLLSFYSMPGKLRQWPGGGQSYVIKDYDSHTYPLNCQAGEKICYGAWVEGNRLTPYWGAGHEGGEACQNCCLTCPARGSYSVVLEPKDAKVPVPTLTWQVQNRYPSSVDLVFYADARPHQWPGENQVYTLSDRNVRNIRIACQANENICYGAWPRGNPEGSGWGLGYNRRLSCSNCCWRCNGGETGTIPFDP